MKRLKLKEMDVVYLRSDDGRIGMTILPEGVEMTPFFEKGQTDPLVQIAVSGDASCNGFASGLTMHDCSTTMEFCFVSQEEMTEAGEHCVVTRLQTACGIEAAHILRYREDSEGIRTQTEVRNGTEEAITLEAVSSFSLSELTPYAEDEATGRLVLHRFRSYWSVEGMLESRSIEEMQLEPSWARHGVRCEKFGAIGSMPVRTYFPFAAIEDREAGVIWAATLSAAASWQIELFRKDENLILAGGCADADYGQWRKTLAPGEGFRTDEAYLTVGTGALSQVCERLLSIQQEKLLPAQRREALPLLFNEYCTTWGEPSETRIEEMLSVIGDRGYEYFVIDAGWYADPVSGWQSNMGDWRVSDELFPNGLETTVQRIKEKGMKPGVWFELEVVGETADARADSGHLLHRNGKVIVSGTRRFWDMRDPEVIALLRERVIDFLNRYGFEYIKIDYNESIGVGCDGAESLGEGLQEVARASLRFIEMIRREVPGIAIEICSSGGHRLTPPMMEAADYLSFSDAHEEKEIPVIAANLQNLVLPRKSQIWAVLHQTDTNDRLVYSIVAGMYGVLCISGDIFELTEAQWELVQRGTDFYRSVSPLIANGTSFRFGKPQQSYRKLKHYQASVRYGKDAKEALVLLHTFELADRETVELSLAGTYEIIDIFEAKPHEIGTTEGNLRIAVDVSYDALAIHLKRQ